MFITGMCGLSVYWDFRCTEFLFLVFLKWLKIRTWNWFCIITCLDRFTKKNKLMKFICLASPLVSLFMTLLRKLWVKPDILSTQISTCFSPLYCSTLLKVTSIIDMILLAPLVPRGIVVVQCYRSDLDLRLKMLRFSQTLIGVRQK